MIKILDMLNIINPAPSSLIDLLIREVSNFNIILGHLLLKITNKRLKNKKVLLIVDIVFKSKS